jgi:alkylated DNA repair dioxygenase AlkB
MECLEVSMTYDLFSSPGERSDAGSRIDMPDAEVLLFASLFSQLEANQLFDALRRDILWREETIKLYGQVHKQPRLTALYGDPDTSYRYSGITLESVPWIPALLKIKERIEQVSNASFNSVLLNRYRDGSDSMGWHADDEPELGRNPIIGSVSLGENRALQMKHKSDKSNRRNIPLANGSFLLMQGAVQHHWLHQIAKSRRQMGERINLTYRFIL